MYMYIHLHVHVDQFSTVKVENYAEINLCGKGVDTPLFSSANNLIVRIRFIANH